MWRSRPGCEFVGPPGPALRYAGNRGLAVLSNGAARLGNTIQPYLRRAQLPLERYLSPPPFREFRLCCGPLSIARQPKPLALSAGGAPKTAFSLFLGGLA